MTTAIPPVQSDAVHRSSLTQKIWDDIDAFSAGSFTEINNHSINLQLLIQNSMTKGYMQSGAVHRSSLTQKDLG